jgi:hypothetical protein
MASPEPAETEQLALYLLSQGHSGYPGLRKQSRPKDSMSTVARQTTNRSLSEFQ